MESVKPFGAGMFWFILFVEIIAAASLAFTQTQGSELFLTRAGGKPTASLRIDPSQPLAGIPFVIYGSGFRKNESLYVGLEGYFGLDNVTTDETGSFVRAYNNTPQTPGTYKLIVLANRRNTWEFVATLTFNVSGGTPISGTTTTP